ncbi:MAG: LysR family transcriptional regulator [Hyphomicrobiaceae bacterium]
MKARQLEIFRAIMQCGSLTGAARVLNVSQPALSQSLMHTEDALGFKLFERRAGRLIPTAEATQLYPEAERLFRELESLRRYTSELRHGRTGFVRIAASAPASLSIVPLALKSFRTRFPEVRTLSYVVPHDTMVEMLRRGEADLGIAMNDAPQADIDIEPLAESEIVCLMTDHHTFAERKRVGLAELAGETLISYRASSLPGQLLARAAAASDTTLAPAVEIDVSIIAAPFVQNGIGIALVDGLLPWSTFAGVVTRQLRPRIPLPLCLFASRTRPPSRHQTNFVEHLRSAVQRLGRDRTWSGHLVAKAPVARAGPSGARA